MSSGSYEDESEEWSSEAESSYFSSSAQEASKSAVPAPAPASASASAAKSSASAETSEFLSDDSDDADDVAPPKKQEARVAAPPKPVTTSAPRARRGAPVESESFISDESEWTSEEEGETEYESDSSTAATNKSAKEPVVSRAHVASPAKPPKPKEITAAPESKSYSDVLSSSEEGESEFETEYETTEQTTSEATPKEGNDMNYILSMAGHDRGKVVTPTDGVRRKRRPGLATRVEPQAAEPEVEVELQPSSDTDEVEVVRAESLDQESSEAEPDDSSLVMSEVLDVAKRRFMALPEPLPVDAPPKDDIDQVFDRLDYQDEMLSLQQSKIATFREYLGVVQREEVDLLASFQATMSAWQPTESQSELRDREQQRVAFESNLTSVRNRRAQFRGRLYDALMERENIARAHLARHTDVFQLREKMDFWKERSGVDVWMLSFFALQVVVLILFSVFLTHPQVPAPDALHLRSVTLSSLFVILGLSFWMSATKRYVWGAVALNLLISAYAVEWGLLMHVFFKWAVESHFEKVPLSPAFLLRGFQAAAATLVSHSALLGRIDATGALILASVEGLLVALNYNIQQLWSLSDTGGSLHLWLFGALLGASASFVYFRGDDTEQRQPGVHARRHSYSLGGFAWAGSLVCWLAFPAFLAASAPHASHHRVLANAFVSLTSSALSSIALSHALHGRLHLRSLLNACLAGGVAISGASSSIVQPGAAAALGVIAGCLACLGEYRLISAARGLGVPDTQGALWLFGAPALVAWLCSEITTSVARGHSLFGQNYSELFSAWEPEMLAASWAITLLLSVAGGLAAGLLLRLVRPKHYFTESVNFKMTPAAHAF